MAIPFFAGTEQTATDPKRKQAAGFDAADRPVDPLQQLGATLDVPFRRIGEATTGPLLGGLGRLIGGMVYPSKAEEIERAAYETGVGLPHFLAQAGAYMSKVPALQKLALGDVALHTYSTMPPELPAEQKLLATAPSVAAFAAAPGVGALTRAATARAAAPVTEQIAGRTLRGMVERGVEKVGSVAGTLGSFELANLAASKVLGQDYDPFTTEHIVGTAASVLPFEALSLPESVRGYYLEEGGLRPARWSELGKPAPVKSLSELARAQKEATQKLAEQVVEDVATTHERAENPEPPVRFIGVQPGFGDIPAMKLYNITKTINSELVEGTTVSEHTLRKHGIEPPEPMLLEKMWTEEQVDPLAGMFGLVSTELLNEPEKLKVPVGKDGLFPRDALLQRLTKLVPSSEIPFLNWAKLRLPERVSIPQVQKELQDQLPPLKLVVAKYDKEVRDLLNEEAVLQKHYSRLRVAINDRLGNLPEPSSYEKGMRFPHRDRYYTAAGIGEIFPDIAEDAKLLDRVYRRLLEIDNKVSEGSRELSEYSEMAAPIKGGGDQEAWLLLDKNAAPVESHFYGTERSVGGGLLGWARVQWFDVPGFGRVPLVFEIQSDLAKGVMSHMELRGTKPDLILEQYGFDPKLLAPIRNYNRLFASLAVRTAAQRGAKAVVLATPELAFYSQGKQATRMLELELTDEQVKKFLSMQPTEVGWGLYHNPETGAYRTFPSAKPLLDKLGIPSKEVVVASGLDGFILNYGLQLPKEFRKLTGYPGEKVEIGPMPEEGRVTQLFQGRKPVMEGLVFPLDKFNTRLAERGGMPMFGEGRFVLELNQREELHKLGSGDAGLQAMAALLLNDPMQPGESLRDYLLRVTLLDKSAIADAARNPNALMETGHRFAVQLFGSMYGNPERAEPLVQTFDRLLSLFAPRLGEVAIAPSAGGSFYTEGPGIVRPTIGLSFSPKSPESAFFVLGHELGHALHLAAKQGKLVDLEPFYAKMEKKISALTPEQRVEALQYLADKIPGLKLDRPLSVSTTEDIADFTSLITMAALKRMEVFEEVAKFAPVEVQNYLYNFFGEAYRLVKAIEAFLHGIAGADVKQIVAEMEGGVSKALATLEEARKVQGDFATFALLHETKPYQPFEFVSVPQIELLEAAYKQRLGLYFGPDTIPVVSAVIPTSGARPRDFGKKPFEQWKFWNYFAPAEQLSKMLPEWVDVKNLAFKVDEKRREFTHRMWEPLWDPLTGKYDIDGMLRLRKAGTPLNEAFSKIALIQNKEKNGEPLTREEKEAIPEYARLSKEDKQFLDTKLQQIGAAMKTAALAAVEVYKYDRIASRLGRQLMMRDKSLRWDKALELGMAICDVTMEADRRLGDPERGLPPDPMVVERAKKGQAVLDEYIKNILSDQHRDVELKTRMVEGVRKLVEQAMVQEEPFRNFRDHLLGQWEGPEKGFPHKMGYTPEVRLGRWVIAWKEKGGEANYIGFANKKEMEKKWEELLRKRQGMEYLERFDREDQRDQFAGLSKDLVEAYAKMDKLVFDRALAEVRDAHPDQQAALTALANEFQPGRGVVLLEAPYFRERRFIGGRETLNMAEGVLHYIDSMANTLMHQFVRAQRRLLLADPQLTANPQILQVAEKYLAEIIHPSGREFWALKSLAFLNYLGYKPTQFFVEMTQQFCTHIPALVNAGAEPGQAYKLVLQALSDTLESSVFRKKPTQLSDEEQTALHEARRRGWIGGGWLQEVFNIESDLATVNSRNLLSGSGQVLVAGQLLENPLYHIMRGARALYAVSVEWNNESAFLSSFRFYRQRGMDFEEALQMSRELVYESMYGGGRANRPLWFLGIGPANPGPTVGGLMYLLQSYTFGAIFQMGRYLRATIDNSKLTPELRRRAFKGAALALAAQFALAGIFGIPFTDQALTLIETLFPGTEPRRRLRELFIGLGETIDEKISNGGLVKADESLGSILSSAALDGILNLGPIDMQSRFQLNGFLGLDKYKGFSWDNVVGPGGDLLQNWIVKTPQKVAEEGLARGMVQAIPITTVRNVLNLALDGWDVRKREKLLVGLTQEEALLNALGFTPRKVAMRQQLNNMAIRAEKVVALEQRQFTTDMAKLAKEGRFAEVRQALFERARKVPNFSPREAATQIAKTVVDQMLPVDPLRGKTLIGAPYEVRKLFPPGEEVSEMARLRLQHAVVARLGFPPSLTSTELTEAQMVDQLRALYPDLGYEEALLLVRRTTRPNRYRYAATPHIGAQLRPFPSAAQF